MEIKAYLLQFSYKLLYFAEVGIYAKWNRLIYALLLIVSLGYLCILLKLRQSTLDFECCNKESFHDPGNELDQKNSVRTQ